MSEAPNNLDWIGREPRAVHNGLRGLREQMAEASATAGRIESRLAAFAADRNEGGGTDAATQA